jgi:O-methyltransferase involved in polyketide biosynthesis
MQRGVALTAYLVNESRARMPELAGDPLAADWIPEEERDAVRALWKEFAGAVYPHDDLVVSLRGRYVRDSLAESLAAAPDAVLVTAGAGFASYPWLLDFHAALEVDLPDMSAAKERRARELGARGRLPERDVRFLGADLGSAAGREQVVRAARDLAAGRPVVYLVEGVVFYLPPDDARAVAELGAEFKDTVRSVVSYWPAAAQGSPALAAQSAWFRARGVPPEATYLTNAELTVLLRGALADLGPEDLQRRYLGEVRVRESALIPEYVAVAG